VCFECIYTRCVCVRERDKESLYVCERDNEESLCVGVCVLRVKPGFCICRRHPDLYVFVLVCVCLYVSLCVKESVCAYERVCVCVCAREREKERECERERECVCARELCATSAARSM